MKHLLSIFVAILFSSPMLTAQDLISLWADSWWSDGVGSFGASVFEGEINMDGGTLRTFGLKTIDAAAGLYELQGYCNPIDNERDDNVPLRGKVGATVELRTINGREYLVVKQEGMVTDILERTDIDGAPSIEDQIKWSFCGIYEDDWYQTFIITPEYMSLGDICDQCAYDIVMSEGSAQIWKEETFLFHLLGDGSKMAEYLELKLTSNGINIYKAQVNEWGDVKESELLRSAQIMWNEEDTEGIIGRRPFTSTQILNNNVLNRYPNTLLRLMRNEIMARHGYNFGAEDLKEYFDREPWYMPGNTDNRVKLNAVENLNVALIQSLERDKDRAAIDCADSEISSDHRQGFIETCPGGVECFAYTGKVNDEQVELYLQCYDDNKCINGYAIRPARRDTVLLVGEVERLHSLVYREDGSIDGYELIQTINVHEVTTNGTIQYQYHWWSELTSPDVEWSYNNKTGIASFEPKDYPYDNLNLRAPQPLYDWNAGTFILNDPEINRMGTLTLSKNANGSLHYRLHVKVDNEQWGEREGDIWPRTDKVRICLGLGHSIVLQNYNDYILVYDYPRSSFASPYTFGNRVDPTGCFIRK